MEQDFIYMIIPEDYKYIYDFLLVKLSNLGIDLLNDCSASCKGDNKYIISCWNMFQAACAAYNLEEYAKATLLFNYIKGQLNIKQEELEANYNFKLENYNITFGAREDTIEVGVSYNSHINPSISYYSPELENLNIRFSDDFSKLIITSINNLTDNDIKGYITICNGYSSTKIEKNININILCDIHTEIE